MKVRYTRLLSLLLCGLILWGCGQRNADEMFDPLDNSEVTENEKTPPENNGKPEADGSETPPVDPQIAYWMENLPRMDGSTSLIPLETGIRAALFGITQEEAAAQVSHSTTWDSFYNLIEGKADLIFSCPLSPDQYAYAQEQGVTLEEVPIAKEGFVFVVNADNPVESLTQDQLRGIYSGQITNWSQVGGWDAPIIAYQRNVDSGSQNYMLAFMGDTVLMDAPTEYRPGNMFSILEVIAAGDYGLNSIGYSVYAYAADMYGNGDEIKFIQVDGVAPTKETMANGEYPLMGYNYAVFNAEEPENGPVRELVEWMTGAEGQMAIAQSGYVTVTDVGYDYSETVFERYDAVGTGVAAPQESYSYEYVYIILDDRYAELELTQDTLPDGHSTFHLTQLADQKLQQQINDFIDEQITAAWTRADAYSAYLGGLSSRITHTRYNRNDFFGSGWTTKAGEPVGVKITVRNGYLSVAVSMGYSCNTTGNAGMSTSSGHFYWTQTATWDLLTGEQLEPEELFCEGVDIDSLLNGIIREYSLTPDVFGNDVPMKADFASLPEEGWHITLDGIYVDSDNPFFLNGFYLDFMGFPEDALVVNIPRDYADAFSSDNLSVGRQFRMIYSKDAYQDIGDGFQLRLLDESVSGYAALINGAAAERIRQFYQPDRVEAYLVEMGLPIYEGQRISLEGLKRWQAINLGNRYVIYSSSCPEGYIYDAVIIYDLQTGMQIDWRDMLVPGWTKYAAIEVSKPYWTESFPQGYHFGEPVDFNGDFQLMSVYSSYGGTGETLNVNSSMTIRLYADKVLYMLEIPAEWIIW